jgi:hypothetical protein
MATLAAQNVAMSQTEIDLPSLKIQTTQRVLQQDAGRKVLMPVKELNFLIHGDSNKRKEAKQDDSSFLNKRFLYSHFSSWISHVFLFFYSSWYPGSCKVASNFHTY